ARAIEVRGRPAIQDPVVRSRLVELEARLLANEYQGYRLLTLSARGEEPGLAGLVMKLASTTLGHDIANLALDVIGDRALVAPGLQVPAAHGGSGLELLEVALAAEELGWCCTPGPFLACALATAALLASGNAEAAARWLPAIARGRAIVTLALGEEGDEWDAARLTTRAQGGTLSGRKPLVPYATVADAILVAAADGDGPGLWLVEGGARGLGVTPLKGTDMTRRVAAVELEAAPATKIAAGRPAHDRARDAGRVLLAAAAYGGARRSLDTTVKDALT